MEMELGAYNSDICLLIHPEKDRRRRRSPDRILAKLLELLEQHD